MIAGDNDTADKFIAGDKNKDAMEVGICQGYEKVEVDKSLISPAADGATGTTIKSCIMPFWFEAVLTSDQGMSGACVPFRGCSNDNIGGRR